MSAPTSVPVLIFDGDCGFCTTCARFLARWVSDGRSTLIAPWQRLNLADLDLTADQCRAAVQWVGEGGQAASGHRAIAAALRAGHPVWRPVGALLVAPLDPHFAFTPTWPAHGWLALLALTAQVIGWLLIASALPRLPAVETSVLLMAQPVFAFIWGWLFFGERLSTLQWTGSGIVLVGVVTLSLAQRKT